MFFSQLCADLSVFLWAKWPHPTKKPLWTRRSPWHVCANCASFVQFEFVFLFCWDTRRFFFLFSFPSRLDCCLAAHMIYFTPPEVNSNLNFGSASVACHQKSFFQNAATSGWKQATKLDGDSNWLPASSTVASHANTSGVPAVYTILSWHSWNPACTRLMNSAVLVEHLLSVALPQTVRQRGFSWKDSTVNSANVWCCHHWAKEYMTEVTRQFLFISFLILRQREPRTWYCSSYWYFCCTVWFLYKVQRGLEF